MHVFLHWFAKIQKCSTVASHFNRTVTFCSYIAMLFIHLCKVIHLKWSKILFQCMLKTFPIYMLLNPRTLSLVFFALYTLYSLPYSCMMMLSTEESRLSPLFLTYTVYMFDICEHYMHGKHAPPFVWKVWKHVVTKIPAGSPNPLQLNKH